MRNRNPARGAARGFALGIAALLLGACASTTVVREEPAPSPIYTDARPSRAAASPSSPTIRRTRIRTAPSSATA